MELKKVVFSGAVGTSAMTIFSYLISELRNQNFREPVMLTILINDLISNAKQFASCFAWALHYFIGYVFVFFYIIVWKETKLKPTIMSGLFLGALSGIFGIIGWSITFKLHPDLPVMSLNDYFIHLFFAHTIFGIFVVIGNCAIKVPDPTSRREL